MDQTLLRLDEGWREGLSVRVQQREGGRSGRGGESSETGECGWFRVGTAAAWCGGGGDAGEGKRSGVLKIIVG